LLGPPAPGRRTVAGNGVSRNRLWSISSVMGRLEQNRTVELARSRLCCTPVHSS
jgi:hypothetical protein